MAPQLRPIAASLALPALLFLAARCGGDGGGGDGGPTGPGPATQVAALKGNNQTAFVRTQLNDSLVVRTTDAQSRPVGGVTVTWAVTSGGGSVSATSTTTTSTGTTGVFFTLGPNPGTQTVTATAPGLSGSPVTFTATASPLPTSANVTVADFSFSPSSVTIGQGGTVTWNWGGGQGTANPHSVTFDDGIGSSAVQSAGVHPRTFTSVGEFTYYCSVHGRSVMSGRVTVR